MHAPRIVATQREFVAYVVVGIVGTALDFAVLWALLRFRIWTPLSVTVAYATATVVQFFLNRHWSFANFDRPVLGQARTYAAVTFLNWLVALAFVEAGAGFLHLPPLIAKALSIPPSAIVGFAGHRYLTFGPGIRGAYRRWRGGTDRLP